MKLSLAVAAAFLFTYFVDAAVVTLEMDFTYGWTDGYLPAELPTQDEVDVMLQGSSEYFLAEAKEMPSLSTLTGLSLQGAVANSTAEGNSITYPVLGLLDFSDSPAVPSVVPRTFGEGGFDLTKYIEDYLWMDPASKFYWTEEVVTASRGKTKSEAGDVAANSGKAERDLTAESGSPVIQAVVAVMLSIGSAVYILA